MFVVKAGTVKTALICPPSKDPKKEKYTIVTAFLVDIPKLSEQAVTEAFKVTKSSKEKRENEDKVHCKYL